MKVLITLPFEEQHRKLFLELPYTFLFENERKLSFSEEFQDVNVLMGYNPFPHLPLEKLPCLRYVQLSSIGIDQAPLSYLKENNISLCNNNGGYRIAIAEWIVFKILEYFKNGLKIYENQKKSKWHLDMSLRELTNKKILFLGTGNIATEAAKRLTPFDVRLIGFNRSGSPVPYFHEVHSFSKNAPILKEADVVVVALPKTRETEGILDKEFFEHLKPGTFLINIARGELINDMDLLSALQQKILSQCALDVFSEEPLPMGHPFWKHENILISSHNSWVSEYIQERRFALFYENLKNYSLHLPLKNSIDLERGY